MNEKELKEEIERIDNLKVDMSNECWLSSEIRIKKFKAEAQQQRNAEVKQVIEKYFDKTIKEFPDGGSVAMDCIQEELLQKLGLDTKEDHTVPTKE